MEAPNAVLVFVKAIALLAITTVVIVPIRNRFVFLFILIFLSGFVLDVLM